MTKWFWLFLAFYILVWQPALLGRILDNYNLYELAILNTWVFLAGWIISILFKQSSQNNISDSQVSNSLWESKKGKIELNNKSEQRNENAQNIKEDKNDEKIIQNIAGDNKEEVFKSMKESVSIPKIVQPIKWHSSQKKKKKKEIKWWQRLILLLTLCLAAIIASTLWEFLWIRWIAISLFLWWILYLIIGKLFDVSWFYNAKKLFTNWLYILLILAWIGYGIYAAQQSSPMTDFPENISSYIKDRFSTDKDNNSTTDTWSVIYVFEWTGEVISDTWTDTDIQVNDELVTENESWTVEDKTWTVSTWVEKNIQPVVNNNQTEDVTEEKTTTETPKQDLNEKITIWEAIKSLLAGAKLSTKTNIAFKYVSKSNELYPYFKTAQEKQMIWTDTNPNKMISCETYITMKWLREWRNVGSYTSATVKTVYWNKATELWKLNGCKKWSYLTRANL